MLREQNFINIADYTQKAFKIFCKRRLAAKMLEMLNNSKKK